MTHYLGGRDHHDHGQGYLKGQQLGKIYISDVHQNSIVKHFLIHSSVSMNYFDMKGIFWEC
jgi:hypothetical protein